MLFLLLMILPVDLIENELKTFEVKFKNAVSSQAPMLDRIMRYIVKRKGKQLRPMFVFLSAKLCGEVNESTYRAASLVEVLHTATLMHDDVVDDSMERRGFFSVYALWKAKATVLIGDYLFAKGLLLSLDHFDYRVLHILSDAVRKMSEGELLQLEKARNLNLDEDIYYNIIRNKTASLVASACAAGAWSTTNNDDFTEKMRTFGENAGMAFQIKDDLFDYGEDEIGKPVGIDIKEKKMTLPLIYALSKASWLEKRRVISIIRNESGKPKKVKEVIEFVKKSGGIEYAQQTMNKFHEEAIQLLNGLPASNYKNSLQQLVQFTIERNN